MLGVLRLRASHNRQLREEQEVEMVSRELTNYQKGGGLKFEILKNVPYYMSLKEIIQFESYTNTKLCFRPGMTLLSTSQLIH